MKFGRTKRNIPRHGLTLIELLVAVAILALMVLVFGQILNSSQNVVTTSQFKMRANNSFSAIADIIRRDLRQASKNGFFCITGNPQMFFATAAPTNSITGGNPGNGSVVGLGQCFVPGGSTPTIIWRAGWVLNNSTPTNSWDDFWATDFAVIQKANHTYINGLIDTLKGNSTYVPTSLEVRPSQMTINDIKTLWKLLATNCNNLAIQWTNGDVDGSGDLIWYGRDSTGAFTPKVAGWESRDITSGFIEFADSSGDYRALWTRDNQSEWPKAIKISFTMNDPNMPEDAVGTTYEIVCPIGQ